jgi:hypothetical protein
MIHRLRDGAIAGASAALVIGVVLRELIWSPGYLIYRDLFPGQLYYPYLWHPEGSFLALENYKFVTYTGIFLLLRGLGLEVFEKAVYLSAFLIAYLAFYWFSFRLLGWLRSDLARGGRHAASAIAALVYVANPAAANTYFDFSLFVGYAFSPLILGLILDLLGSQRRLAPTVLLAGGVWWLAAIKAHWIVFGALLLAPPVLMYMLVSWNQGVRGRKLFRPFLAAAGVVFVYLVLSAYWLVPFFSAREGRFVGSYAPMTYESVDALSSIPFSQAVRLLGSYPAWPYVIFESPVSWLAWAWALASWVIPIAAIAGLYVHRRHWQAWVLAVFVFGGVLLAKGTAPPLGALYNFLVFGWLTPSEFRWLFRVSSKWVVFSSLGYSGLVAAALGAALQGVRLRLIPPGLPGPASKGFMLVIGFLIAFIFYAWPSFTGNFGGALQPVRLPSPLVQANRWLGDQPGDSKVHWMPVTNGREIDWNRRPSGDLYTSLSKRPSIATNWNRHPVLYYSYAYEALVNGRTADFGKLMSVLNTGYVAYHDDVVTSHIHEDVEPVSVLIEEGEAEITDQLRLQRDMRLAWEDDFISIFATKESPGALFVPQQVFLTTQDLSILTSLAALDSYQPHLSALLFDASRSQGRFDNPVDGLILGLDAADYLAFSRLPVEKMLAPAETTFHGSMIDTWSRLDVYQFDWQSALHLYSLDDWDFDYGKGFAAYTDEVETARNVTETLEPSLEVPFTVDEAGQYSVWIRFLRQPRAGDLYLSIGGVFYGMLTGSAPQTGFVWEDVGPVSLLAGQHMLSIQGRKGLSAVNAIVVLSETEMEALREESQALARQVPQLFVFEAESDFDCSQAEPVPSTQTFSSGVGVAVGAGKSILTDLELVVDGAYRVAVRAGSDEAASLWVRLGDITVRLQPSHQKGKLDWLVSEPVYLPSTLMQLEIGAEHPAVVDVVALCSQVEDCPEGFFQAGSPPAEIRYEAVDPTRFRVQVNARRPFMLAFAETYDPLWAATAAQTVTHSLPLYGVINGFYLDQPGSYSLVVEYQIQQGARVGRLLTALAGLFLGLAFFWLRRDR